MARFCKIGSVQRVYVTRRSVCKARHFKTQVHLAQSPLNTCLPCACMGARPLRIVPSQLNKLAGDFSFHSVEPLRGSCTDKRAETTETSGRKADMPHRSGRADLVKEHREPGPLWRLVPAGSPGQACRNGSPRGSRLNPGRTTVSGREARELCVLGVPADRHPPTTAAQRPGMRELHGHLIIRCWVEQRAASPESRGAVSFLAVVLLPVLVVWCE
jgi:hypothetical protein